MNILIGTLIIGSAAILMLHRLPNTEWRQAAYKATFQTLKFTIPRIFIALLGAGLFAELLPTDHIKELFGQETGFKGLCMAALFGPITPGGAFVSFAIGSAAIKAGADVINVICYVTSWTLFSSTRILGYELPFMGLQTTFIRIMLCLPIPIIIGVLAHAIL